MGNYSLTFLGVVTIRTAKKTSSINIWLVPQAKRGWNGQTGLVLNNPFAPYIVATSTIINSPSHASAESIWVMQVQWGDQEIDSHHRPVNPVVHPTNLDWWLGATIGDLSTMNLPVGCLNLLPRSHAGLLDGFRPFNPWKIDLSPQKWTYYLVSVGGRVVH